jgi:RNA polymerase sigma-70 factor (ECF subfamily)
MEPWLLTIAGNRCRTMLAARKRHPVASGIPDEELVDRGPSGTASRLLAEELAIALQQIRPEHREAFLLFHEHHLNYDEISQAMGRPLGTIKTWIRRARQELAGHLRRRRVLLST